MVKIQQTIIIGLGSSGKITLEHLKRRMDQAYGELPGIKLLALDVPSQAGIELEASETETVLSPTELIYLPVNDLNSSPKLAAASNPWLSSSVLEQGPGWQDTRAAYRVAFGIHAAGIVNFLEYHLHQLDTVDSHDAMANKGFEIISEHEASLIILAGLEDPTGSALLVDMAYLVEYLIRRKGLQFSSTAILTMPSLVPAKAADEARAYAALKELDSYLNGRKYQETFANLTIEFDLPPFNKGCYLIDSRNEKNVALRSQDEVHTLVAEWLFRTIFTSLKTRIDGFVSDRNPLLSSGHLAAYSSLGYAAYVLPIDLLVDWCASSLGSELITGHILKSESFVRVSTRLADFFVKSRLRPDKLMEEELRLDKNQMPFRLERDYILRLKTVSADVAVQEAQKSVNEINKDLTSLKKQIGHNTKRVIHTAGNAIRQEVDSILCEWPEGGISLASQFVSQLIEETDRSIAVLQRRESAFQSKNMRLINQFNVWGVLLKYSSAGIPPLPMLILAILAGFGAPMLLASTWIWQGLQNDPLISPIFLIGALWVLALSGLGFSFWKVKRSVQDIRDRFVASMMDRFKAELNLALVNAASLLYPELVREANKELERLQKVTTDFLNVGRKFKAALDPQPLCGEIRFALQRSVLTEELVEELYQNYLGTGKAGARLAPLVEDKGQLPEWIDLTQNEIEQMLLDFGRRVFAPMRDLRVETILEREMDSQSRAERMLSQAQDKAAALWTYDQFKLGQDSILTGQTFIGMETSLEGNFKKNFVRVNQATIFEPIDDPYSIIITQVRCGMPLFGLRRIEEFRKNYLEVLKSEGEPLHLGDELTISPDLLPEHDLPGKLDPAMAFALALAFGFIKHQASGQYVIQDTKVPFLSDLTRYAAESAVLLGADEITLNYLSGRIQSHASQKGGKETIHTLTNYLDKAELEAWQRRHIMQYIDLLQS